MPILPKVYLIIAAASGLCAVLLGAFGAHALRTHLDQQAMAVWQTAVQYHFIHTLLLIAVSLLMLQSPRSALTLSGGLLVLGLLLFSGSLYLLALGGPRWLGPVTPVGGLCFIVAWASLLVYAIRT